MSFDVVIRSGLLVDGTGAVGRLGDLGVTDGRITAITTFDPSNEARVGRDSES